MFSYIFIVAYFMQITLGLELEDTGSNANASLLYSGPVQFPDCAKTTAVDYYCLNCGVLIHCSNKQQSPDATTQICASDEACFFKNGVFSCNDIHDPAAPDDCKCPIANGFFPDDCCYPDLDQTWYIDCLDSKLHHQQCPENQIFEKTQCVDCITGGHLPFPDCTGFYSCYKNDVFLHKEEAFCNADEIFSITKGMCIKYDGSFLCGSVGLFSDPFDCRRYQDCSSVNQYSVGHCCSSGMVFDGSTCIVDTSDSVDCSNYDVCIQQNIDLVTKCPETCPGSCGFERIPDPNDCHGYLKCLQDANGAWYTEPRKCPSNFSYKDCYCIDEGC